LAALLLPHRAREYFYMNMKMMDEPQTEPRADQREGRLARTIEQQTAKLPSDVFLWAALGSIAGSLVLKIAGDGKTANFVGQWAPTFLILGLYNKMVKLHGSEGR
jgi:hypothetical protein